MIVLPTMRNKPIDLPLYDPIHGSKFRIVSAPWGFHVHPLRIGQIEDSFGGQSEIFVKCHPPSECEMCQQNYQHLWKRYYMVVNDRDDNLNKYFEISVIEYAMLQDRIHQRGDLNVDFMVIINPSVHKFKFFPLEDTQTGPTPLVGDDILEQYYDAMMTSEQYLALKDIAEII